jgi:hypothetical protein
MRWIQLALCCALARAAHQRACMASWSPRAADKRVKLWHDARSQLLDQASVLLAELEHPEIVWNGDDRT